MNVARRQAEALNMAQGLCDQPVPAAVSSAAQRATRDGVSSCTAVQGMARLRAAIAMREPVTDGMTMVVVTHQLGFAREVAHRVVYLDHGARLPPDDRWSICNRNGRIPFSPGYYATSRKCQLWQSPQTEVRQ